MSTETDYAPMWMRLDGPNGSFKFGDILYGRGDSNGVLTRPTGSDIDLGSWAQWNKVMLPVSIP
jgi:hypothetical protein